MDQENVSLLDDPNAHYGLGYSATSAGGGIARHFDREIEARKEQERKDRETHRELVREAERLGVAPPRERYSNAEAYEATERLTREIQRRKGCSFLEASQIAREAVESGEEPEVDVAKARERDYLGDTIENLMRPDTYIEPQGARKSSRRRTPRPSPDSQVKYDRLLGEAS